MARHRSDVLYGVHESRAGLNFLRTAVRTRCFRKAWNVTKNQTLDDGYITETLPSIG